MSTHQNIEEARQILEALGMPRAQQNERSALALLALLNLRPGMTWEQARAPLMGITPIMEWAKEHHNKSWKPNTRETVRRQSIHQFVDAGLALKNPDCPERPVNSPKAVYQVSPEALRLLHSFGRPEWDDNLDYYIKHVGSLAERYSKARDQVRVPVRLPNGEELTLSAGEHSELIRDIVEDFGARFAPGSQVVYLGDTESKTGFFDRDLLSGLGVEVDSHGKMPDVVLYCPKRDWLLLIESVTSHGPVDGKRYDELSTLFKNSSAGLVYVTAFPSRALMRKYLSEIAWETEVWNSEEPSHLIHFNGVRFLGPYN